jgi:hypothetical protein
MDWGYQHDSHVMAWWLWCALRPLVNEVYQRAAMYGTCVWRATPEGIQFIDPEDWTRYDGELL